MEEKPSPETLATNDRLAEIKGRWELDYPSKFKTVNESPVEMSVRGHIVVTKHNQIAGVFPNYDEAIEYTQISADIRFLLDHIHTLSKGQNSALQTPKE